MGGEGGPKSPPVRSEIPLLSFLYLLGWAERVRRKPHGARGHGVLAPSARPAVRAECARTRSRAGPVRPSRFSRGVCPPPPWADRAETTPSPPACRSIAPRDPIRGHCQAGSLTRAVHLSKDKAGVLRPAQRGQKLAWSKRAKAGLILMFNTHRDCESMAYRSFWLGEFPTRGVRKVTTGITGLWRPSVHSDVAFWSFDVGSSYHCEAEFAKRWIVHPPIGNVSWV